jgi:cobalt-zinc-cadmium resistance protein CzcA
MLNHIIAFSIKNKLIVGLAILALILYGSYSVTQLPIDAVPDITNNQVLVITSSPSLGAADIERQITFPIEQATINIPGIIEQRSFSRFGLSLVTIVFDDKTDVYFARQQVNERLLQVRNDIPKELGVPTLGPVSTGLGEIFQYVIKPLPGYESKYSPMELRTIQDWIVRRQLLGTEGVADVSSFGGKLKQYEIAVSSSKLKSYRTTINEIFTALNANNQNTGGAYIEKGPTILSIRSEGLVQSIADIENILIKTLPGEIPLRIRDVAEVKIGTAIRYGAVNYNDEGEVAGAIVMMLKGENSGKVIKLVKARIEEIKKTLPEGVTIEPFLDRTKMVNNAIGTVEKNLFEGALIVIFILVLFLGNLRAGLLVASVIPLAMLFAIIMMNLFGVSGNLMSLGALDFGLIVDGAVIIVEAIMHRLHHGKHFEGIDRLTQDQMDEEVSHSSGKMMNAAVFGQIIILIVYLPILTLEGIEGKMFRPMAETVAFAILGAFILSLTYIPMMSSLVISKNTKIKKTFADRMMHFLEGKYKSSLEKAMSIPKTTIGLSVALFAVALFILTTLGGEFIPKLEEGDFAVDTRVLTGSSLTTTIQATSQAAGLLKARFPEVEKIVTKIGSGEIPTDPMPVEASDMMIILKPKKEWTSAKTFDELAEKMSKVLEEIPGITAGFQFPVQMRFNELMTGGRQDVVCKIFGEDLDTLSKYAEELGSIINSVDGAADLYVETVTGLPQIVINYNRDALAQFGVSMEEVNRTIQTAFAGASGSKVYEGQKNFDLVVRLDHSERKDLSDVQNLQIATSHGTQIPLSQLADVSIKVGPNQIQRENAQRRISVGFNVRGRDVQSIVSELKQKQESKIKLPPGYQLTYGGQFENLEKAKSRLSIAVPAALLLIFLMLYFAFNSIPQGVLIFTAIPLSAIGGVFALWTRGMPFSISAGIGFIALFGVAVLNGIVLITEFNLLKAAGMHSIKDRILKGTQIRLRPVLITAFVASLGFLPMALSNGAGAEVQRPLATVVIGGLFTATLLTLLVLPLLYRWNEERNEKKYSMLNKTLLFFPLLTISLTNANAQTSTLSLQQLLDSAMKNNSAIQVAALQTLSEKKNQQTAWDLPNTTLSYEYGQINSYANDKKLGIDQTIAFPGVYVARTKMLKAKTEECKINELVVQAEIKKEVLLNYYQLLITKEKIKLLAQEDSLHDRFLQIAEQRFNAGETDVLEKATITAKRTQVKNLLIKYNHEAATLRSNLRLLINSNQEIEITESELIVNNTTPVGQNISPLEKLYASKEQVALADWKIARNKMLPDFLIGYNSQTIVGFQNNDGTENYYSKDDRFSSVKVGLNVPLFFHSQKARIASSKLNYRISQLNTLYIQREQSSKLNNLQKHADQLQALVLSSKGELNKQSSIIRSSALSKLNNGEINYSEWLLTIGQAFSIDNDYFDLIKDLNVTLIEIKFITNQF